MPSDVVIVALITAVVTLIGSVSTYLFVTRRQVKSDQNKDTAEAKKADSDSNARDAEISKLKDDITATVIGRARDENIRLFGRVDALEQIGVTKEIQLASLRNTVAEQGRSINSQRDQIASLIDQLAIRNSTITQMKTELERQAALIEALQRENADLHMQLEAIAEKTDKIE